MVLTNLVVLLVLDISDVPSRPVVCDFLHDNNVLFVLDTDELSSHVDNSVTLILEHLPPSICCVIDLHVGRLSIALNLP
jgi:hypothetical protein